jgi:predicted membrane protein
MKSIVIVIAAIVLPMITLGQMKKYEYTPKNKNKVEIHNLLGDILLQNTTGNAIVIESDFKMDTPDRAKGLRLLGSTEDNTELGVNIGEENGIVMIEGAVNQVRDHKYKISIPAGMAVNLDYNSPFAKDELNIDSFKGSLEVNTLNANVKVTNSSGPFAINTISGNLEVNFSNVSQDAPTSLASVSGVVDVTVPAGEKASLQISTINGNIYNNLDLKSKKEPDADKRAYGMRPMRQEQSEFTLNGGGQKVYLKSISGNIYLRKR